MRRALFFAMAMALAACGGDDDEAPMARVLERGGVADAPIRSALHVHVVDSQTSSPIEGATVWIGSPAEPTMAGATDAMGLFTLTGAMLTNSMTVSASAPGRSSATYFGVRGSNVTIGLDQNGSAGASIATVRGTIAGFNDLPGPTEANHFLIGLVDSTRPHDVSGIAGIPQPMGMGEIPDNACARGRMINPECAWTLRTRTGPQTLFAIVFELDTKGTMVKTDDEATLIHFGYLSDLDLAPGEQRAGVSIELTDDALVDVTVDAPDKGSFDSAGSLVGIDYGPTQGVAMIGVAFTPAIDTRPMPPLSGALAGKTYWVLSHGEGPGRDGSTSIARGLTGEMLTSAPLPGVPDPTATDYEATLGAPPGVDAASVELRDDDGKLWTGLVLDGSATVPLPSSMLVTGTATRVQVNALQVEFDPEDFTVADVLERVTGLSSRTIDR